MNTPDQTPIVYAVEIAIDTPEADQFAAWLREQGHTATVGRSTGSYIDGAWTSHDAAASEIMRDLWQAYCDQPPAPSYYEQSISEASGGFGEYQAEPINGEAWADEADLLTEMAQGVADQGGELIELIDGCPDHLDIRGRIHDQPGRVFAIVWDDDSRGITYTGITTR